MRYSLEVRESYGQALERTQVQAFKQHESSAFGRLPDFYTAVRNFRWSRDENDVRTSAE
jgi:hypothetical protein